MNKRGQVIASLESVTKQHRSKGCRTMEKVNEKTSGNIYDRKGNLNYYTAELYASLFFTYGSVCGENNIVRGTQRNVRGTSGIEKHKEQLKMLFFNPGARIPGIPFMGNKINIFDPDVAKNYDFNIDMGDYDGQYCYIFTIKAKTDDEIDEDDIVIDHMTTWFNSKSMEIVARTYQMSYNAGAYDFDVQMEVQMQKFGDLLVPKVLRYKGDWDVAFKKRERGVFTATLTNFSR